MTQRAAEEVAARLWQEGGGAASHGNGRGASSSSPLSPPADLDATPRTWETPGRPREIAASELRREIEAGYPMLLVDVREVPETAQGVIPGALLIPVSTLLARIGEVRGAGVPIVTYCAAGVRSASAAQHLMDRGVESVSSLRGGIQAWIAEGGAVVPPSAAA